MPTIVLSRSLTFPHRSLVNPEQMIQFRRGDPVEVSEPDYNWLLARGGFRDPEQQLDFMLPRDLFRAPSGTTVPVFRDSGLGDVLMATIPLRDLAAAWPHLRFNYCTNSRYLPMLRDVAAFANPMPACQLRGRFPYAIDLRGYSESHGREKHYRIDVFAKYLLNGRHPSSYRFPLYRRPEEAERGAARIGKDGRPAIGIVAGCDLPYRDWPLDYQERLAQIAYQAGWKPVWLHSRRLESQQMAAVGCANLTGQTSCQQLLEVIQGLDTLVGPDTGTIYLGEALEVRTIALYTTIPPEARLQNFQWVRAMYAALPCAPCFHNKCELEDPKPCAVAISPEAVWAEAQFMSQRQPPWPLRSPFEPLRVAVPASRVLPQQPLRPLRRPVRFALA